MSSDYDFDDDFDDAALAEVDAIEQAALQKASEPAPAPPRPQPKPLQADSSIDFSFDIDDSELQRLDDHVEQKYNEKVLQIPGPSSRPMNRTNSSNMLQRTLFGEVLQPPPSTASKAGSASVILQRTHSTTRNLFGQQAPKTKIWDHTAFAQSGLRRKKSAKGKGKGKAKDDDDDDGDDFELPPPFVPIGPSPPMKVEPDLLEAKHWVYPINRPKRDYQYNIVKNCLFDNTLVALPTGLGKTFVAGVVMLNYYRWYPQGKIIFVAPTKPLVAQQIVASHETCGIPGSDGIELTGSIKPATRERYWQEKRVFYMTPQTLESDLNSGTCDPSRIVLLVIDEAHHATGDYSYNKVVRFMMAKNPHYRLLALTATPGNNVESIQKLIDGLHISRIEIRNEQSLDLKPYLFQKVVSKHIIKPSGNVFELQELFRKTMDPIMKPLREKNIFFPGEDCLKMHPFRPTMIANDGKHPQARFHRPQLSNLSSLARGVMYLLTGSIASCRDYLEEVRRKDLEAATTGKKRNHALTDNPNFQTLMRRMDELKASGATPHPKMEKLKDILINYFGTRMQDTGDGNSAAQDSRVMVFSSYRAVVEEIIKELDQHRPLIRAAAFIGQATDKSGRKGLKQSEQIALIDRFQKGEFNVLVATCIGEEGLDIGEIDLTICYDTDKAPTRMIQRFGRTGRKRAGEVHALLAETREEFNLEKAKDMYKEVQKIINRGDSYELYGDVPRLLPDHMKPECVEKVVEMEHYVRDDLRKSKSRDDNASKGTKRKRNIDPNRNIPPDMPSTFTSANSVWKRFSKKSDLPPDPPPDQSDLEALGEDDEIDKEIEAGIIGSSSVRRTQSDRPPPRKKKATSPGLRRSATAAPIKSKTKKLTAKERMLAKTKEATLEQLVEQGKDDDVDLEIENGIFGAFKRASRPRNGASTSERALTPDELPTYEIPDTDEDETIEGADDELGLKPKFSPSPKERSNGEDMGWLVDDDEDVFNTRGSPEPDRMTSPAFDRIVFDDDSIEISQLLPSQLSGRGKQRLQRKATNMNRSPPPGIGETASQRPPVGFQLASRVSFAPEPSGSKRKKTNMSPPPIPSSWKPPSSPIVEEPEQTQFPVAKPKRRRVATITSSDGEDDTPVSPPRRLKRHSTEPEHDPELESTPAKKKAKNPTSPSSRKRSYRAKPSILDRNRNPVWDAEAAHSGDEASGGHSSDDMERSSDREFIKDDSFTQASPSYQQTQMYRQSLFTQAPMGGAAPMFGRGPARAKLFGRIGTSKNPEGYLPSSSPPLPDEELDSYEYGSFIVPDGEVSMEADLRSDDPVLYG